MTTVALALSPHLDDAAFSCGGTLARLAASGGRVVVATVFTASVANPEGFALACQLDKGLAPEVDYMALRRREDAAAMAGLGAEAVWLDLPEAPHRGYGSAAALFGPVRESDDVDLAVAHAIGAVIRDLRPALLLAPQGIGRHVDHVQLVRALRALDPGLPCLWWRDFPYAVRDTAPAEPFADAMAALPEVAFAQGGEAARRKREACRAYASQLGFQFGGEAALDATLAATGGVERFRLDGEMPGVFAGWESDAAA